MSHHHDAATTKQTPKHDLRPSHQQTAASTQALKDAISPLKDHLISIAVLPDFAVKPPPPLLRATGHYHLHHRLPSGLAVSIPGSTPITDDTAHLLVNDRLGTGTTLYPIKGRHSDQEIEQRWKQAIKSDDASSSSLPELSATSSHHSISIVRQTTRGPLQDSHAIEVTANDAPSAVTLMEKLHDQRNAESSQSLTVGALVKSADYADQLASSQCVRNELAEKTASAIGVELSGTNATRASTLTHGIVAAGLSQDGTEKYTVLYDAQDTSSANNGVFIKHGLSGMTHVKAEVPRQRVNGAPTHNWSTSSMSVLPTTTGTFDPQTHKRPIEVSDAVKANVHWNGIHELGHPALDEKFADPSDPTVRAWLQKAQPTDRDGGLVETDYKYIAGIVPNTTTRNYASIDELTTMAKKLHESGSEIKSLTVPFDSPVVNALRMNVDHIPSTSADAVFANTFTDELDPVLTVRSACNAHQVVKRGSGEQHTHGWHTETVAPSVRFGRYTGRRYHQHYGPSYRRRRGTFINLGIAELIALSLLRPQRGWAGPPIYNDEYY